MKIYIAGGITRNENYIIEFAQAQKYLEGLHHEVINPVLNKGKGWIYKQYIDAGLKQLMSCDTIYMLKNWQQSKGAYLELKYAKAVGMNILYEVESSWKGKSK